MLTMLMVLLNLSTPCFSSLLKNIITIGLFFVIYEALFMLNMASIRFRAGPAFMCMGGCDQTYFLWNSCIGNISGWFTVWNHSQIARAKSQQKYHDNDTVRRSEERFLEQYSMIYQHEVTWLKNMKSHDNSINSLHFVIISLMSTTPSTASSKDPWPCQSTSRGQ